MEKKRSIIGGEFAIQREDDRIAAPLDCSKLFASGRTALYAILQDVNKEKGCQKILLPDYLCNSITKTVQDYGMPYVFYHIQNNLYPDWEALEGELVPNCAVLLINYFGVIDLTHIVDLLRKSTTFPHIILDDVQNYFGFARIDHDYAFSSHRKWFSVPDGAMVSKKDGEISAPTGQNMFASYKYAGNLLKGMAEVPDEVSLFLLEKGERLLENDYLVTCSEYGKRGYARINFREIETRRKQNAEYLHRELSRIGIEHAYMEDTVPLFIPTFLEERDNVRKKMFQENIYTPVHWPYVSAELSGTGNVLYDQELSLICDQRYNLKDMERQIAILCG